ncbi:MAG TPA: GGDEF domain-containing protein, partial [Longimicrobiaceae bacterium]|nr:GGDEF domain-containing protein [Longimicrobiaceae bacterium]
MQSRSSPLYRLLDRLGVAGTAVLLVAASALVSVLVTCCLMALWSGAVDGTGVVLAAVVPMLAAPPFLVLLLRLVAQLRETREELRRLSVTDELTGAFNRRHFLALAEQEMARARRYGDPFAVMLLDLDDFKEVNDRWGHAAGDHVLRSVADACRAHLRESDVFARLGGDEFVLLLTNTNAACAAATAERLRRLLGTVPVRWGDDRVPVNASVGIAAFAPGMRGVNELVIAADQALLAAKRAGKG